MLNKIRCLAGITSLLLIGLNVHAESNLWTDSFQIHGFISQGYTKTDENNFYGNSVNGSFDFRDIAVNASARLSPKLLVAGQVFSRRAGEMADGSPTLDYALLDYTYVNSMDWRSGIILGRIKNPYGLYNESRDLASSRPSIFLPQSIYFDQVRDLMLSSDGIQLYANKYTSNGFIEAKLNYGMLSLEDDFSKLIIGLPLLGKLEQNTPSAFGRLLYDHDVCRIRLASSLSYMKLDYIPAAIDFFADGNSDVNTFILSAQYNAEKWSVTTEVTQQQIIGKDFGSLIDDFNSHTLGYYIQGTYRIKTDWELLLRYDVFYVDDTDKDGSGRGEALGRPPHLSYSKDWTIGVRWDVTDDFMLRAEYHNVHGASWLSSADNDLDETSEHWQLFSLLAAYQF